MSKIDKLIGKILNGKNVSYSDAERVLLNLGFTLNIKGSHHIFRKSGFEKTISIKRRPILLDYQIQDLQEVLKAHGYKKKSKILP